MEIWRFGDLEIWRFADLEFPKVSRNQEELRRAGGRDGSTATQPRNTTQHFYN